MSVEFTSSLLINEDTPAPPADSADLAIELINGKAVAPAKLLWGPVNIAYEVTETTPLPTQNAAIGAETDAEYTTGNGSVIAILKSVYAKLSGTLTASISNWPSYFPSGEHPLTNDQLRASALNVDTGITQPLTNDQLRAGQLVVLTEDSYLVRAALTALTKLTNTMNGLRIDVIGGALSTVNLVSTCNQTSLGRNSTDGQGIQMSQLNYNQSFRRNLTIT